MKLRDALFAAAHGALIIGIPLSIGYLVYQLSPRFGALTPPQQVAFRLESQGASTAVALSALSVIGSAGLMLALLGRGE